MRGAAVERDRFDGAMRGEQDRPARRLVHAARLHADEAVLDEIEPADAIVVAELVERGQQGGGQTASPSIETGSPFSKAISTIVGLSGADSGSTVRE